MPEESSINRLEGEMFSSDHEFTEYLPEKPHKTGLFSKVEVNEESFTNEIL